jgi:hypothetical protein
VSSVFNKNHLSKLPAMKEFKRPRSYIIPLFCLTWLTMTSEKCDSNTTCNESVVAVDMSKLDGCGMILMTNDDKKLLPINLEDYPVKISNGDQLSVSYTVVKDGMSICMAEDAMIKLTCLELISPSPEEIDCPTMTDPVDFSWSKQVLLEIDLRRIEHIATSEGDYYWFRSKGDCRLYKCTGQFICIGTCDEKDECETYFASQNITVNDTRIIYVRDN